MLEADFQVEALKRQRDEWLMQEKLMLGEERFANTIRAVEMVVKAVTPRIDAAMKEGLERGFVQCNPRHGVSRDLACLILNFSNSSGDSFRRQVGYGSEMERRGVPRYWDREVWLAVQSYALNCQARVTH